MSDNQKSLFLRLRKRGLSRSVSYGIVKAHPVLINRRMLPAVIYPTVIQPLTQVA